MLLYDGEFYITEDYDFIGEFHVNYYRENLVFHAMDRKYEFDFSEIKAENKIYLKDETGKEMITIDLNDFILDEEQSGDIDEPISFSEASNIYESEEMKLNLVIKSLKVHKEDEVYIDWDYTFIAFIKIK